MHLSISGSLKGRLVLWFLILSLVPTLTVSLLAFTNSRGSMESSYLSALSTYASSQADAISKWVEENIRQLQLVASAPGIKTLKDEEIMRRLKEYVKTNPAWEMLFWADLNGKAHTTLDSWADVKDRDYFQKVISTGQPAVSNGIISKATNRPIVVFAVPILKDGRVGGVLGATVTLEHLAKTCKDSKLMSQNGYGFIIQSDGLTLAFPDESMILKANFLQTESESVNSITRKMIAGEDGVGRAVYNGQGQLVAYAPIKGTSWSFGVQEPISEAFTSSNQLLRFIIIIVLVATAIIIFVSYIIGTSLANPIVELTGTADELAKGDLTVSIKESYSAEVGRLAKSLSTMANNFRNIVLSIKDNLAQVVSMGAQIRDSAGQSAQAVQQIATTIQGVATGAQRTAQDATEVSTGVENISKRIDELAENANTIDQATQETARLIEEGKKVVDELNVGFSQTTQVTNSGS